MDCRVEICIYFEICMDLSFCPSNISRVVHHLPVLNKFTR